MGARYWVAALLIVVGIGCNQAVPDQLTSPAAAIPAGAAAAFTLPPPATLDLRARRMIWSTTYIAYLAINSTDSEAVPLIDKFGRELGPRLPHADWCHAAMEGTVSIRQSDGSFRTFNFEDQNPSILTDCSDVFPHVAAQVLAGTNRARFAATPPDAPFGLGAASLRLVPWRSVAVDSAAFALQTVLFIPSLRGTQFTLPDGRPMLHDGYVMAVDRGGAIHGMHIDFFKGPSRDDVSPPGLDSSEDHLIPAVVVSDDAIIGQLRQLHQRQ
jgi:3D (Asp-Asp-Asp) domain-containing protein